MHAQMTPSSCGIAAALAIASRHRGEMQWYTSADSSRVKVAQKRLHAFAATRMGAHWPEKLGTAPWALQHMLETATGRRYRPYLWNRDTIGRVRNALDAQDDIVLYTGGNTLPATLARFDIVSRHVVTLRAGAGTGVIVFDPATGTDHRMSWDRFVDLSRSPRKVPAFGNWRRVTLALIPDKHD
ncbi:MAG: hypothetical protein Q4P05_04205 [Actinomycetaceae bacterium]|nr:hypothetical protein [Actinomycetaceae bacterium]